MCRRFLTLLTALFLFSAFACSQGMPNESSWNVMIYLPGSDLESNQGLASEVLEDIAGTVPAKNDLVRVFVMTGGVGKNETMINTWKNKNYESEGVRTSISLDTYKARDVRPDTEKWLFPLTSGMDLSGSVGAGAYQFWEYKYKTIGSRGEYQELTPIVSKSMCDGNVLSYFLRNCSEIGNENAKNMLVIWDHGSDSFNGLISDETDTSPANMSLMDLKSALRDAGVRIDLALLDMSCMSNVETLEAVKENIHYLVSCEGAGPSHSFNYSGMLDCLYAYPKYAPKELGQIVVDTLRQKYADNTPICDNLSCSLIDVTNVDAIATAYDEFIGYLYRAVASFSQDSLFYKKIFDESACYGTTYDIMDTADKIHGTDAGVSVALSRIIRKAVVYSYFGRNMDRSHGLAFYYHFPDQHIFVDCSNGNYSEPDYMSDFKGFCGSFSRNYVKLIDKIEDIRKHSFDYDSYKVSYDVSAGKLKFNSGFNSISNVCIYLSHSAGGEIYASRPAFSDEYFDEGVPDNKSVSYSSRWPKVTFVDSISGAEVSHFLDMRETNSSDCFSVPVKLKAGSTVKDAFLVVNRDGDDYSVQGIYQGYYYDNASHLRRGCVEFSSYNDVEISLDGGALYHGMTKLDDNSVSIEDMSSGICSFGYYDVFGNRYMVEE